MEENLKRYLPLIFLILSLVFSCLLIVMISFPFTGVAIVLGILLTLVYSLKGSKSRIDMFLFLSALVFSVCILWRANPFLTFLNIVTVFYLGTLLSLQNKEKEKGGFIKFASAPLFVILEMVRVKNIFPLSKALVRNASNETKKNVESLKSIGITLVLLLIIIPLLASANPFFEKLVTNIFSVFQLQHLFGGLFIPRGILFVLFFFFIPRLISFVQSKGQTFDIPLPKEALPLFLPKAVVIGVLLIFFITQAQLYFSDLNILRQLDYTYSQYAREVFAQLTVVAGILIALLYNDRSRTQKSKLLTYALLIEGIFLTLMAFKSVNDYSNQWGFTEKRLWGYTGVFWMIAIFGAYIYTYKKQLKDTFFVQSVIGISLVTLLLVNVANFDYLIYNFRKSVTERGVDYGYLATLSPDAQSYKDQLLVVKQEFEKRPKETQQLEQVEGPWASSWDLLWKIEALQGKYKKFDWRTFNLSEYQMYREVKGINVDEYRRLFTPKEDLPQSAIMQNDLQYVPAAEPSY